MTDLAAANGGRFIGLDEAGYGPNLGPLVIAATRWQTPGSPGKCPFVDLLSEVIDPNSSCDGEKLHIADSKLVNIGKHGFRSLETSALSILQAMHMDVSTFQALQKSLCGRLSDEAALREIPWFAEDLQLPVEAPLEHVQQFGARLRACCETHQLSCLDVLVRLVPAKEFNRLLDESDSKGEVLSRLAFNVLATAWDKRDSQPTLIVGDKHGGRNRYDAFLEEIVGDQMIFRVEETRAISRYRIGRAEIRFQTRGEQHFPVAVASIVAKYLRELSMIQFNRFWMRHSPDAKPTKGYPTDAVRFRKSIRTAQQQLNIDDDVLWRRK